MRYNLWPQRDLSDGRWFCEITSTEDDTRVLHETFSFDREEQAIAAAQHWVDRQMSSALTVAAVAD